MNESQKKIIDCDLLSYDEKLEKTSPSLKKFCLSRIFNKEDALDVAQNCLSILIKKRKEYDPSSSFYSWAMTICRFQIKGYMTSKKRSKLDFRSPDSLIFQFNKADHNCPLNKELKRELKHERQQLINNIKNNILTKKEKNFLELSLLGHSKDFIQKKMELSTTNYSVTKSRLIKKIKIIINAQVK